MPRLCALLLLACCSLSPHAEEVIAPLGAAIETAPASLPDPAALAGDWWDYFAGADADGERLRAFEKVLAGIDMAAFSGEQRQTFPQRRTAVLDSLQRYLVLRASAPAEAAALPALADTTSLADVYRLDEQLRQAAQRGATLDDDLALLEQSIDKLDAALARRRLDYQQQTGAARLLTGLAIMQQRAELEYAREQQRRLRAATAQWRERQTAIEAQLAVVGERLAIDAATLAKLEQERAQLADRVKTLGDSADLVGVAPDSGETVDLDARLKSQARLQQRIELEAARARLHLRELEIALAGYLADKVDAKALRARLTDTRAALPQWSAELQGWARGSERARLALMRQDEAGAGTADQRQRYAAALDDNLAAIDRLRQATQRMTRLGTVADQRLLAREGRVAQLTAAGSQGLRDVWQRILGGFTTTLFELGETPVTAAGLLRVLLIITIAWWVSRLVQGGLSRLGERRDSISRPSLYALGRMLHYVILAVGFLIGLSSIGVNFTKFALLVSALGVGIGFGLQAMVSNFVSGLIILFERSLKVGDFVDLESGVVGEVKEINIRSTRITTNDNVDVLVPNSEFVNGRVINWTLNDALRRIHVPFGVAYGSDKELVKRAALEAATRVRHTLTDVAGKQPDVWLVGFGDSSLDFELVVWLRPESAKSPSRVQADYLWEIETSLAQYDIEIPFPQRDLHLRSLFGQRDADALAHIDTFKPKPG